MPGRGIQHIDLAVGDLARSLAFYLDVLGPLGLKEEERYPTYRGTEDVGGQLVGSDYRSEIFYTSDEQRRVAEIAIMDADAADLWPGRVVTELSAAGTFWEAEAEDQGYLHRYPEGNVLPRRT